MLRIRITCKKTHTPSDELKLLSDIVISINNDTHAVLDVNLPRSRDDRKRAYIEFETSCPDLIKKHVGKQFLGKATVSVKPADCSVECLFCNHVDASGKTPPVCSKCKKRDIGPCPYCKQDVSRTDYVSVNHNSQIHKCPKCNYRVKLSTNDWGSEPAVLIARTEQS